MKEIPKIALMMMTLLLPIHACGDDGVESLSNTEACQDICSKYETCFTEIDETACIDHCQDEADRSENVEAEVEACEGCIDDRSCAEAATECAGDCALVPLDVQPE